MSELTQVRRDGTGPRFIQLSETHCVPSQRDRGMAKGTRASTIVRMPSGNCSGQREHIDRLPALIIARQTPVAINSTNGVGREREFMERCFVAVLTDRAT